MLDSRHEAQSQPSFLAYECQDLHDSSKHWERQRSYMMRRTPATFRLNGCLYICRLVPDRVSRGVGTTRKLPAYISRYH